jgi:cellulose synthase/poly-beta-1,6-N-acetylglucosamine synthase-like glycosyltransferase
MALPLANLFTVMPKVSVIIATRNRCSLLPRAVESARAASNNGEIVVVDDASEDHTVEVCNTWDDVRCIHLKQRVGVGAARNVGLVASTSPYVSFLDDDDLRLPGSLDAQVAMLETHPQAGMIYGQALYGDDQGQASGAFYPQQCPEGDLFWDLLRWNFIPCPSVVFRRECLTRLGLLEQEAPGVEDWDLWVRIAEMYSVIAIDKPVAIWRQSTPSSDQLTSHEEQLHREAHRLHREKWLRLPRATAATALRRRQVSRQFAERASQELLWAAASRLKAGQILESARVALAGTRTYPLSLTRNLLSLSTLRSLRRRLETYWRARKDYRLAQPR